MELVAVMEVADGVGAVPELLRHDEIKGRPQITKVTSQERFNLRSLFLFITLPTHSWGIFPVNTIIGVISKVFNVSGLTRQRKRFSPTNPR